MAIRHELTDEQLIALAKYIGKKGTNWRSKLRKQWLDGTADPLLQQIRNESANIISRYGTQTLLDMSWDAAIRAAAFEQLDNDKVTVGGRGSEKSQVSDCEDGQYAWVQTWSLVDISKVHHPATTPGAWDVSLNGSKVDTVFYEADMDADAVRKSLIEHDGYHADIVVTAQTEAP